MRTGSGFIIITALLITLGGPLLLAGLGLLRGQDVSYSLRGDRSTVAWRLVISSTLLYTLAFNIVFFIQEFFLVLPKALTPNLSPTLFHNNHEWTGDNPLARLFQGTGAGIILLVGIGSLWWLSKRPPRATGSRLFLIWIAYHGLFESLPQVVVGAFLPQNDVGMAMDYLKFSPLTMQLAALLTLSAIIMTGMWLTRPLLSLSSDRSNLESQRQRIRFIFQVATLPALISLLLIFPFRLPGSLDQVVLVPVAVSWIGISWIQANAWRSRRLRSNTVTEAAPIRIPLIALIALFLFFQLILRPGITF